MDACLRMRDNPPRDPLSVTWPWLSCLRQADQHWHLADPQIPGMVAGSRLL